MAKCTYGNPSRGLHCEVDMPKVTSWATSLRRSSVSSRLREDNSGTLGLTLTSEPRFVLPGFKGVWTLSRLPNMRVSHLCNMLTTRKWDAP